MATNRKELSKKTRFEVFKRDKFTCQYCGQSAPDVILEVDHIKPVAEGGKNDMLNLITSCRDCNRGKGKIRISDDAEVKKQINEIKALAERREQMEMLLEWRNELVKYSDSQADCLARHILCILNEEGNPSEYLKLEMKRLLKQFSFQEIIESTDISFSQYYLGDAESVTNAIKKIGGICYNRRKEKERNGDL